MTVIINQAKKRMQEGKIAASFNVSRITSVEIAGIAKSCGFHWLFIDLEHTAMDLETASQISIAALPVGVTPIVRVPEGDTKLAQRLLDNGAQGIVFPHVESAEEAERLVKACRFPPAGHRSLTAPGAQLHYGSLKTREAMDLLDRETLIVVMVETPEAASRAGEIARVPGVDVVLIGSNDMCAAMDKPGQLDDPEFVDLLGRVVDDVTAAGKWPGLGGVYQEELLSRYIARGIRIVLGGSDLSLMFVGARQRGEFFANLE
ncbi:MAG: HpcH/HpaI aldolase family protein [Methyloligellaceae bacterium]